MSSLVSKLYTGLFASVIFGFCCSITNPSFAALAPVESRSSHTSGGHSAGSPVSESIAPQPVFSGTNRASAPTSAPSSKPVAAPASNYPMTSQDRAAHLTLSQIENLQREVGELRGLVETQEHTIKQLKKSQQDLYLDLERRINQLQNAGPRGAGSAIPVGATVSGGTSGNIGANKTAAKPAAAVAKLKVENNIQPAAKTNAQVSGGATSKLLGDQETYQNAYAFVRSKKYPEAVSALQDYLSRFQKGEQAPQAHYWLGEVYMVQWQNDKNNQALLEKAATEFLSITNEYPSHPKTADALLKLGLIEIDKGNPDGATEYLSEVKTRYPGSAAARIAETRLQQLAAD